MEKRIAALLTERSEEILAAWRQRIVLDARHVMEQAGVESVDGICRNLLTLLIATLYREPAAPERDAAGPDPSDPARGADERLDAVGRRLGEKGVTPMETARFIFSLKDTLSPLLAEKFEGVELIAALETAHRRVDALAIRSLTTYLAAREEIIDDQRRAFREVSVPVVRIWDRIIMIPLVGMLDSERTQLMMQTLLSALEDLQAKVAILDISGIPVVDTLVARHLITTASAVRMMGAECVITGVRARIAQTLVELGIDLGGFVTRMTLADGLATALQMTDQRIG